MKHARWCLLLLVAALMAWPMTAQEATTGQQLTHVVRNGETLYRIALRYGVPMDAIAAANSIANFNTIYVGQSLVIPGLGMPTTSADVENPLVASPPIVHTVSAGETIEAIASTYGTTVDNILKANGIANPNLISVGQQLNVWSEISAQTQEALVESVESAPVEAQPEAPAAPPQPQVVHTVQRGEFLAQIARRYSVNTGDIIRANNISNPDRIYAGQQLVIPGAVADPASQSPAVTIEQPNAWVDAQGDYGQRPLITPPQPSITTGKLIMVDLSDSMTYAFQDGVLVYSALSSMGLPATPTVKGQFRVYSRYDSQTMSGPGYYLPGVQYVQYFYQGYALHSAYWHDNFGQPMSHGCVNLRTDDAAWLYAFSEIGTPVHVID